MNPALEKEQLFQQLLADGVVTLHLDPRQLGVQVPARFKRDVTLLLSYSYNYHISDFHFDHAAVTATLSFSGQPSRTVVPWRAVFAVTDASRRGHVWEADLPAEVRAAALAAQADLAEPPPVEAEPPTRPGLQVLAGGQSDGLQPTTPRPSGHLRRIK